MASQNSFTTPRRKLPKSARLLKSSEFKQLRAQSLRVFGSAVGVQIQKGKSYQAKLGITVSKKFGKAHERNRFKRLVREAFREIYAELEPGMKVNVFPKAPQLHLSYELILGELKKLLTPR